MKPIGLHVMLTHKSAFENENCFVWGSANKTGVMTLEKLNELLQQAIDQGTVREIFFENGETIILHWILVKAVHQAHMAGFITGVRTNGYWATDIISARNWLKPLVKAGLNKLEMPGFLIDNDLDETTKLHPGLNVSRQLRLNTRFIPIDPPADVPDLNIASTFPGHDASCRIHKAVTDDSLPQYPWDTFASCPYENLENPERLRVDPQGNLQLCQGLLLGNVWEKPLKEIVDSYNPENHPIVSHLWAGGPALLAEKYQVDHEQVYANVCHFCYKTRQSLYPQFADFLAENQVIEA